jgi:hypothetical protein
MVFGYTCGHKKISNSFRIVTAVETGQGAPVTRPLEGEDIQTEHWEDARHWMSIYDDLIRFKLGLLDRVKRELPKLHPVAQYQRVWQLHGLWLDPDGRVVRHKGQEAVLTHREFELLQFLLDHPHRYFTASQITALAWSDAALFPEEVRNYVLRIRKILTRLAIPCDLVNKPGKGYSLTFRDTDPSGP